MLGLWAFNWSTVQVGVIYNPEDASYRPRFTQPGGPGTVVLPQQQPGEQIGLFVFGCGHWFNNMMVRETTYNWQAAAFLQCPVCDYLQRIVVPYSAIQNNDVNPILIA